MGVQENRNSSFTCYVKVFLDQFFEKKFKKIVLDRFFKNFEFILDDSISHYFYIILQYLILLNFIIVSYYVTIIYLALFLLSSFYFHFCFPISFTWTLQILLNFVLHLLLYLVFLSLYLLSVILLFLPRYLLSQKCQVETNSFILFFKSRPT